MKNITRNRFKWFLSIFVLLLLSSCVEDQELDKAVLKFDDKNIFIMNLSLGFIMFGVALQLKIDDFKRVFSTPKSVLIGFISQFIALPFLTFLLVWIFKPMPSIAMGMMIVAACPGGNISNFMTSLANGNTALSVCMTAIASVCAVIMTPFNIGFYGKRYPATKKILEDVNVDFFDMLEILGMILLIPLVMGMTVRYYKPKIADLLHKFTHYGSILIFGLIIVFAFVANMDLFLKYIHLVIFVVFAHNAIGIFTGFSLARLFKLSSKDQKTLAIETGIQNSGLGLGLISTFFYSVEGVGGMAIVAGWWGIWHIVSGLSLAYFFRNRSL
ncbi:MAG: bile acid:sodium symporter family protein [Crocinitomicaceae bacterium]|jgi:bile acid:Na+ symporter, BASS family|nr:bile acid:sodium symporter family protein [Crocinitomicaceae bacterium]